MRLFRWITSGPIPAGSDLRRVGWLLLDDGTAPITADASLLLIAPDGLALAEWLPLVGSAPPLRRRMMMVGVADPQERARFLRLGFGDAVSPATSLSELEARAIRVADQALVLPRQRQHGALRLDLLAREAFVAGRAVGLHPREFALLWRLADVVGDPVSPTQLMADVWRMHFRPETNSLAVHVSRLRTKLRSAGLDEVVVTLPDGSYRLNPISPLTERVSALPLRNEDWPLDWHVRRVEQPTTQEEDPSHAT